MPSQFYITVLAALLILFIAFLSYWFGKKVNKLENQLEDNKAATKTKEELDETLKNSNGSATDKWRNEL
jgi:cytochrome oxidase Cu insertion factor (SCO1/SenC/PrrC family)